MFPHPATLTVLQAIFVTAAGLVLYALARIYLEPTIAVLIVLSFYGANAVLGPALSNFHDISQIPLFVFSLLLAMEKRWWWLFAILAICVLAVREDSGITLFGVGMYMILSRRHPRIGLAVCSVSFIYLVALTNLIMPLFSDDISKRFMLERFGQYADGDEASTIEIMLNMATRPWLVIAELFSPFFRTIKYLAGQWLPLAFIPVVAPASWAIAGFPLLKLLLGKGSLVLNISIRYAMSVTPGLFYGAILWWAGQGFANVNKPLSECKPRKLYPKFRRFWIACICISILFTITSNPSRTLYFLIPDSVQPWVYRSAPDQWKRSRQIKEVLAKIPDDASVSATTYLIPHLSGRREIIRLTGLEFKSDRDTIERVDYVVADLGHSAYYQIAFKLDRDRLQRNVPLINEITDSGEYGIIEFNSGVILLQRGVESQPKAIAAWKTFLQEIEPVLNKQ